MGDENLVVTVRLSDVCESEQPDPICLPIEELATWRHFEALLESMYRDPPPAIKVCYLDDESDWIEVSSDTELKEAIQVAQNTDYILQLQVKRKDAPEQTYFESTLPQTQTQTPTSARQESESPHVTPLQTRYFDQPEPESRPPVLLVYPSHSTTAHFHTPNTDGPVQPPLVYPSHGASFVDDHHHHRHHDVVAPAHHDNNCIRSSPSSANENVMLLESNGRTFCLQNRPDLSTEEKMSRLRDRLSGHKETKDDKQKGLNTCSSFREMWQHASNFSSEEKVQFMKSMTTGASTNGEENCEGAYNISVSQNGGGNTKTEPFSNAGTAPVSLAVQDPFEVVCHDKPSTDLEQIQLNLQPGNILKPEKPRDLSSSPTKRKSSEIVVIGDSNTTVTPIPTIPTLSPSAVNAKPSVVVKGGSTTTTNTNGGGGGGSSSNTTSALSAVPPPVPLLYTLQMMDGAQSGANAVAIEIPEGDHHGAAQKEEDVTASGGAACTSASAETGEIVGTRLGHDGAAVGDKVKVRSSCQVDEPVNFAVTTVAATKQASKKGKKVDSSKSADKDALKSKSKKESSSSSSSKEGKKEKKRIKEKEACHKHKREKSCVRIEADVESGEKVVKRKESSCKLHRQDLIKLMAKMQTELHTGIVKDVGEQTDKLLRRTLSRTASYESSLTGHGYGNADEMFEEVVHRGIYCDSCNAVIRGIRFKCGNCEDFDFCEKCEATQNHHDPSHVFLKLRRPAPQAGKVGMGKIPLLREIVFKENRTSPISEEKKVKITCLEDVPILSISEVTTPGRKASPPSTPSESHKKVDINNWVWDSTFDTDKHLYPLEGEGGNSGSNVGQAGNITTLSPESSTDDHQPRLSDAEMKRLYALLSIEAEAAKRSGHNVGEENCQDLIAELHKLSSVPEMAESVHSLSTLPTATTTDTAPTADIEAVVASPRSQSTSTSTAEASSLVMVDGAASLDSYESPVDGDAQDVDIDLEDDVSLASSAELLDVEEEEDEEDEEEEEEEFEDLIGEQEEVCTHQRLDQSDSDTSDDFCVLDPPSRSDSEEVPCVKIYNDNEEKTEVKILHHIPEVPAMEFVDQVRAEGKAVRSHSADNVTVADLTQVQNRAGETSVNCISEEGSPEEVSEVEEKIEAVKVMDQEASSSFETDNKAVDNNNDDYDDDEKQSEAVSGETAVEENKEIEKTEGAEAKFDEDDHDDDVLMNMSVEERRHFLEMVTNLKERAGYLEKELKVRKEAEAAKETERQYQVILEEKQKEAVKENEKLEQLQKKKEQEDRAKRLRQLAEKEKERKHRQIKKKEVKHTVTAVGEGVKRKTSRSSALGSKPTLMQMALDGKVVLSGKQKVGVSTQEVGVSSSVGRAVTAKIQADNVVVVQRNEKKDADCQTSGRAGVGGADAAAQASQMIHQVATGVSKAAGAAFHTAKDVFYSLQAKQVEKKTYEGVVYSKTVPLDSKASPTDATAPRLAEQQQPPQHQKQQDKQDKTTIWMPPSSVWTPPQDTYVPPKSEWTPPKSDWTPPEDTWTPPRSEWTVPRTEWTPPKGYYQPPTLESESNHHHHHHQQQQQQQKQQETDDSKLRKNEGIHHQNMTGLSNVATAVATAVLENETNGLNSSSASSTTTTSTAGSAALPLLPPIQITDPILRREVQGIQLLIEMGFANREQNRRLLQEYDGDVEKAVQNLLQEEREEHWAWQRH